MDIITTTNSKFDTVRPGFSYSDAIKTVVNIDTDTSVIPETSTSETVPSQQSTLTTLTTLTT